MLFSLIIKKSSKSCHRIVTDTLIQTKFCIPALATEKLNQFAIIYPVHVGLNLSGANRIHLALTFI
jgi:hypothetical protein